MNNVLRFNIAIIILTSLVISITPAYGFQSIGIGIYRGVGIPIIINVEILPGNGTVYIEGVGYDGLFRYSTYIAVYEAMFSLGLNPLKYNYVVSIEPDENMDTYLMGPSLSEAIYLATISSYTGIELRDRGVYTGSINPDLTVGFVGYIEEKARGAANHSFKTIFVPAGEKYKYKIEEKPLRIGPYIFESYAVEKIPYNLTGMDIHLKELNNSFTPFETIFDKVNIFNESNLGSEHLRYVKGRVIKYVNMVLDMTRDRINDVVELIDESNIKVVNPSSYRYLIRILGHTGDNLSISEYLLDRGYLGMALEHSMRAYEMASKAFYLTVILTMPKKKLDVISADYFILKDRVSKIVNTSLSNGIDVISITYKSYSARFFIESSRDARIVLSGLNFFQVEPYVLSDLAISLAEEMAGVVYKLLKAEAYSYISIRYGDSNLDISVIAQEIYRYTDTLFKYVYKYSQETKVLSDLISLGGYSLDRAKKGIYFESPNTINELARISYLIDSISNLSLYMALHPGFEEIYRVRYTSIINSLSILLSYIHPDWLIFDRIQSSELFDDYPVRIRMLEEAIAHIKVKLFLRGVVEIGKDLEITHEGIGYPLLSNGEGEPIYIEYLPTIAVLGIILVITTVFYLKRRGRI